MIALNRVYFTRSVALAITTEANPETLMRTFVYDEANWGCEWDAKEQLVRVTHRSPVGNSSTLVPVHVVASMIRK